LAARRIALPPVIHVAGTNGKGLDLRLSDGRLPKPRARRSMSIPRRIWCALTSVSCWPGEVVDDARPEDAFARCEAANGDAPITFFEITTAAAFLLFAETPGRAPDP
jgi:dihydrofolate synthase/folylpolyglutamate synthase